jgi:hypothetical protein
VQVYRFACHLGLLTMKNYQQLADAWIRDDAAVLDALSAAERRAIGLIACGATAPRELDAAGADFVLGMKSTSMFRLSALDVGPIARAKDEADNVIPWVYSTESVDRAGDIIRQKGWQLGPYRKNPVVLWAHAGGFNGEDSIPIGRSVSVGVEDGRLVGRIQFAVEEDERAARIYRLAAAGYIKASSVGFHPLKVNLVPDEKERESIGLGRYGVVFEKQELLEHSLCAVPCNAGALQLGVKAGTILEADADMLAAMATERDMAKWARRRARSFVDMGAANTELGVVAEDAADSGQASRDSGDAQPSEDDGADGARGLFRELIGAVKALTAKLDSDMASRADEAESRRMLARAITNKAEGASRGEDSPRSDADARSLTPKQLALLEKALDKLNRIN